MMQMAQCLSDAKNLVQALRTSETSLELRLEQVRISLRHALVQVAQITNRSAPISCLSNEILTAIFEQGRSLASNGAASFPLLVSHVATHWRAVAVQAPSLWTQIDVQPRGSDMLVSLHLERSQPLLLEITLTSSRNLNVSSFKRQLDRLGPHICRCRRMVIQSSSRKVLDRILAPLRDARAPRLVFLRVESSGHEGELMHFHSIFAGGAPALKTFAVNGINLHSCLPPLAAITTLRLDCCVMMTLPQFSAVISSISSLTDLSLTGKPLYLPPEPNNSSAIEIFSLLSLELSSLSGVYLSHLCAALSMPALESLKISHIRLPELTVLAKALVDQRASRKYPALKSLRVSHVCDGLPVHIGSRLADAFPDIVDLHLTYCDANRVLRFVLASADEAGTPSSQLAWLQLRTISLSSVSASMGTVCAAISARIDVGLPIATLRLGRSLFREVTADEMVWLRDRVQLEAFDDGDF